MSPFHTLLQHPWDTLDRLVGWIKRSKQKNPFFRRLCTCLLGAREVHKILLSAASRINREKVLVKRPPPKSIESSVFFFLPVFRGSA